MQPEDLILISVDDHICEPADMFDGHVPERYRDQAPRVVVEPDGTYQWWYGKVRGRNIGLNAVAGKPREMFNVNPRGYDEMRPGCYDVHERVRDMSAGGQLAGLNFPNWPGFAAPVLSQGPDPDVNLVMVQAYNDWHVDEWCASYPERFIPCGVLPLWDAEAAATELRRLAGKGCHAVTFSENPAMHGAPTIHSGGWDPVFAAASDEGTILCCHVGSSSKSATTTPDAPPSVGMTLPAVAAAYSLSDFIWADVWNRFPDLRFSLTEGDIGWIPYFLQRADHVQQRHGGWTGHEIAGGRTPSELFLDRIIVCFINDAVGIRNLDLLNIDNVCWESDFPHSDTPWPYGPEAVAALMEGKDRAVVDKITHGNAMRLFQFDPFAKREKERCTVGALRAEATDVDTVTRVGTAPDESDRNYFRSIGARTIAEAR
ncbi:MAG TPA: amidohydrolase family protein [Frankiaceae bacterium]|jgi:predicted TIM-barrel fold metal-dependent hydrolase|nr:amidohydrolase family protein [Frankiaceae bacterium]